jgi:anti-sigma B factor antagonist
MASVENPEQALGALEGAPDESGVFVIKLIGEIDISNAATLGSALDDMVVGVEGGIVVDLSALEFMDSSGIAMLLRAVGASGSVAVRNPSTVVRRIIECTGLAEILRIEA